MHELSIASNIVEMVTETALDAHAERVLKVHLRLGALAGISVESLRFCYEIATANTLLAGSELVVEHLSIVVYCSECNRAAVITGIQAIGCPLCGTPSTDIRQGHELEIASIEIEESTI